uniref:SDR family NAD(P)-dependent oxidoreductase n=1 Tax=Roseihalotalea indica TaxID=2867963 RepID=A0AA49GNF9_9BACT|nr:SDR family NAD(P)-dependent oxidoreductase [Tunicatimonas sp. TK19036]
MNTLVGKVALVTGAGSGIGAASARRLAEEGAKVALVSRTRKELEEVATSMGDDQALVVEADVSKENEMKTAYESVIETWGQLDIVFVNAGVNGVWAPLEELTLDEWQKTLDINLTGTFLTVKYAVPHLKKQGGSVIIGASVNGTRIFTNTGATAYSCSKAGQVAFTKMIALELAKHKIRVNVICPGAINTEIEDNTKRRNIEREKEPVDFPEGAIPLTDGFPGEPEQVADLVYFLASDLSSHITGTEVWIDGGESLLQG